MSCRAKRYAKGAKMKISTFILHILKLSELYGLRSFSEALESPFLRGIDGVEGDTKMFSKIDHKEIKRALDGMGLCTPCVYHEARCDGIFGGERERLKDEIKLQLERCAELGTPIFMAVPCCAEVTEHDAVRSRMAEYFRVCAELSGEYGIRTAAENYASGRSTFATIADTEWFLNKLPEVDFVLDTGNYFFSYSDVTEAFEKFLPRLSHVHVKDIKEYKVAPPYTLLGRGYDSMAIGEGDMPIRNIVDRLSNLGYRGAFSIEISSEIELPEKMRRSIDNLSRWIGR